MVSLITKKWRRRASSLLRLAGKTVFNFGKGNKIVRDGATWSQSKVEIFGDNNQIECAPNAKMHNCHVVVLGSNNHVKIGANATLLASSLWIHGSGSSLHVGTDAFVNDTEITLTENGSRVSVGSGTMLGPQSVIRCGDGHAIIDRNTGKILNRAISVELEENVLVGTRVQILKNVRIGKGSIIGACAVVTEDVPEYSLAAGVPSKVIRSGVTWSRKRIDDLPEGWSYVPETASAHETPVGGNA